MNYREMVDWHNLHNADITIATIQVRPGKPAISASPRSTRDYRIVGFEEKPQHGNPARAAFDPEMVSASMGIYVFNTEVLLRRAAGRLAEADSSHDFGKDVIPGASAKARVVAYDFRDLNAKQAATGGT